MAISAVKFTLNGTEYVLTLDSGTTYKKTITAPSATSYNANSDHKYHGTVTVTDTAGNATTVDVGSFAGLGLRVLEKTPPVITPTSPTASSYITSATPTITFTVADVASGVDQTSITLKIDSGSAIPYGSMTISGTAASYSCSYSVPAGSALADGSHTIYINASDNDGNAAAQVSITFTVDTVAPSLVVTAPTDGLYTNVSPFNVYGTCSDTTSGLASVTVNGHAATINGSSWSYNLTLSQGANTVTVVATDVAGKTTTITRTVYLDTTAPTVTSISITPNPVDAGATYIITVVVADS